MKKTEFYVPAEKVIEVSHLIGKYDITNQILGVTEDDEIILYIESYPKDEEPLIELRSLCDSYEYDYSGSDDDNVDDDSDNFLSDIRNLN